MTSPVILTKHQRSDGRTGGIVAQQYLVRHAVQLCYAEVQQKGQVLKSASIATRTRKLDTTVCNLLLLLL